MGSANTPSKLSPVDAPVKTSILNSRPASCSLIAFSAMAFDTTFGAPAGVKPLNPTRSPFLTIEAASSAVMNFNDILLAVFLDGAKVCIL